MDEAPDLLAHWHTILLGECIRYLGEGQNPFKVMSMPIKPVDAKDNRDKKNFAYRHAVLQILSDSFNRRVTQSVVDIFGYLKREHKMYYKYAVDPSKCKEYAQKWASPSHWQTDVVLPTIRQSLHSSSVWRRLGFGNTLEVNCTGHLLVHDGVDEDKQILHLHFDLLLSAVSESQAYAIVPQTWPWNSLLLLHPSTAVVQGTIEGCKRLCEVVEALETDSSAEASR